MSFNLYALVEGQTEYAVLQRLVAPYLGVSHIFLRPRIVGKPGHKGGVRRSFETITSEIVNLFKQDRNAYVTTFFDFYALPAQWAGVEQAKKAKLQRYPAHEIANIVEGAWKKTIAQHIAPISRPERFIPYVQMHELEALLFANPKIMAEAFSQPHLEGQLKNILNECDGCEEINDGSDTAPSKRIQKLYRSYRKGKTDMAHAPQIVERIGVPAIRDACPHFNEWLSKLESIGISS